MSFPQKISIDGTAASGKSTIGELLANKLGYAFLDTGKLYRAISLKVLRQGITASNKEAVILYTKKIEICVRNSNGNGKAEIIFQGDNLADLFLYTQEINNTVPIVAAYPEVREKVRIIQRQFANLGEVVIAGRDIGTVVMPEADFKLFLKVSLDERVRRRYESLKHSPGVSEDEVRADILRRDDIDSNRSSSPLRIPNDAIIIQTDGMEPYEVVEHIIGIMKNSS